MNGRLLKFLAISTVLSAFLGCGEVVKVELETGPKFEDIWLSADSAGVNHVESFGPEDRIHLKADLIHAAAGTKVTATLIAVKVDHPDVTPNTEIGSFEQIYDGKLNRMNFDFENDGPWPVGEYIIKLAITSDSVSTQIPLSIFKK